MSDEEKINLAREMILSKRAKEAIDVYQTLIMEGSIYSSEAAYGLGIIYHTGNGIRKDSKEAERYYLQSVEKGFTPAKYWLATIYYEWGEMRKSYDFYQQIAGENPSAAFWAYRLLTKRRNLDPDPVAAEAFLNSAVVQGHLGAKRVVAMRLITGAQGIRGIPIGIRMFVETMRELSKAIDRGEKLRYT